MYYQLLYEDGTNFGLLNVEPPKSWKQSQRIGITDDVTEAFQEVFYNEEWEEEEDVFEKLEERLKAKGYKTERIFVEEITLTEPE